MKAPSNGRVENGPAEDEGFIVTPRAAIKCSLCGKVLNPPYLETNKKGKKWICDSCLEVQAADEAKAKAKVDEKEKRSQSALDSAKKRKSQARLYDYIKQVFGIDEVPESWVIQLDKMIKDDPKKNYSTLWFTMYYAIEIEGFMPSMNYGISFIPSFYSRASNFYKERQEVLKRNEEVELSTEAVNITMRPPEPKRRRKLTNIEEL